ncbi:MAG: dUTP diphosphatase [Planctomycetes bacterium]|nr:dUTP diphosphatase [Planctomycetota bacterium]
MRVTLPVKLKRLPHGEGLPVPGYQTEHAAGADVHAALEGPVLLQPGRHAMIPTGFCYEIPPGYEMQVRPRSGLAAKHGITVLNAPGTIDADYRGELKVLLINHGPEPFEIQRGERIAQIIIAPVVMAAFKEVNELSDTSRGQGGFGSTGK